MTNLRIPESQIAAESAPESNESFGEMLSQYEKSHSRKAENGTKQLVGTVIVVTGDSIFLDIGFKSEGILPLAVLQGPDETVKPGDKLSVSVKGRDPEGYYQLTRAKVERPKDWPALEKAFADKATIVVRKRVPREGDNERTESELRLSVAERLKAAGVIGQ